MIPNKPIEKWKFDLQIILALIAILLSCCQAIVYFLFELAEMRLQIIRYLFSYAGSAIALTLLGFQIILFRPYTGIKNLLITILILKAFNILEYASRRFLSPGIEMIQILMAVDALLELGLTIICVIVYAKVLGKKFNKVPLVRLFRTYAVVALLTVVITFIFSNFLSLLDLYITGVSNLWPLVYLMIPVPYIFLILYYQKIKNIYPRLIAGNDEEPTENWPPPSTI